MYTIKGGVKDAALIKAFISKNASRINYHQDGKQVESYVGEKLVLQSHAQAEKQMHGHVERYQAKWNGNALELIAEKEGTVMYNQSDEAFINFHTGICKYKPIVYDKQALATSTDFSYQYKTKPQFFASLEGNQLLVDQMIYTLKTGDKNAIMVKGYYISNKFDAKGLANLRANDTLVIQEFVVVADKE
ncbi:hypothetical protein [Pontibacter sp. H249]|uniref:hypothetical protein n=1 Tax=Pontibacter sp. H249 TaxID=3133420 RepID=UPI0030BDF56B